LHVDIHLNSPADIWTIIPFGCVHYPEPGHCAETFRQLLEELKKPNTKGVGLGDVFTWSRGTLRKHLATYVEDEDSYRELDKMVRGQTEKFYKESIEEVQHNIIGFGEGNHYHQFQDGTTSTQYLCQLAGVPYLDKPAVLRIAIGFKDHHPKTILKGLLHHGDWSGGSASVGGDITAQEKKFASFPSFDFFFASHTHRKTAVQIPSLDIPELGRLQLIERPRIMIRTGCFIRGYDECVKNNYAQRKLLSPTEIGYVKLEVFWERPYDKEKYSQERMDGKKRDKAHNASHGKLRHKFRVIF